METHFPQSEGNDQSCDMKGKVFEIEHVSLIDFDVIEWAEAGKMQVSREKRVGVSQFFSVDTLLV